MAGRGIIIHDVFLIINNVNMAFQPQEQPPPCHVCSSWRRADRLLAPGLETVQKRYHLNGNTHFKQ